jgi:thiol-disulfide isomerase/thioredoxin
LAGEDARTAALAEEIAAFQSFPFSFQLPNLAGETISSEGLPARLLVVDIWATWCGPCQKSIPEFVALQRQWGEAGVQVVGITCDSDDPAKQAAAVPVAQAIAERRDINYPLLIDDGTTKPQVRGFRALPTTLFVDSAGQVRFMVVGMQSQQRLTRIIRLLLDEQADR